MALFFNLYIRSHAAASPPKLAGNNVLDQVSLLKHALSDHGSGFSYDLRLPFCCRKTHFKAGSGRLTNKRSDIQLSAV